MRKTRKLCAIMLDTLGREVMIRRPFRIDPGGWPNQAGQEIEIKMGQTITLTTRGKWREGQLLYPLHPVFLCSRALHGMSL